MNCKSKAGDPPHTHIFFEHGRFHGAFLEQKTDEFIVELPILKVEDLKALPLIEMHAIRVQVNLTAYYDNLKR